MSGKPGFGSFAAIQRESTRVAGLTPSVANAFVNKAAAQAPDGLKLSGISSADGGAAAPAARGNFTAAGRGGLRIRKNMIG